MKVEQQEIYDVDTGRWYTVIREPSTFLNRFLGIANRLVTCEQIYTKVRKAPTGNHLYFDTNKKLHYRERGPRPKPPGREKVQSLSERVKKEGE